jgi:hypothetical protein
MQSVHNRAVGFQRPSKERALRRRATALAQLMLTLALVASITVAITAVTIGMARADTAPVGAATFHGLQSR